MGAVLPMPGPWHTLDTDRGIYIIGPSSSLLAIVQPYHSNVVQNEANARLIASAPDLLEALQSLVANLAEGDFISETRIDAARAAITKATGEAS
jgi:hypothetical protein